jgi:CspA family cold shock protein
MSKRLLSKLGLPLSKVGLPTLYQMLIGPMVSAFVNDVVVGATRVDMEPEDNSPEGELAPITGQVKWFDATRGFGFLVSDQVDGDVLIHFSVLRDHGRRSIPEGATIECIPIRLERGLQAKKVLSIDLSTALPQQPRSSISTNERADRGALADAAGEFEAVEVKWFNRVRGYGFVKRADEVGGEDVFVHMETVRNAHLPELEPGQKLQARIAPSGKGLTAVELQGLDPQD